MSANQIALVADIDSLISNEDEWGTAFTLTTPDGGTTVDLVGLFPNHSIKIDPTTGTPSIGRTARITVTFAALEAVSYPYLGSGNTVNLKGHTVVIANSVATITCKIIEFAANYTLNHVVCMLAL